MQFLGFTRSNNAKKRVLIWCTCNCERATCSIKKIGKRVYAFIALKGLNRLLSTFLRGVEAFVQSFFPR